MNIKEMFRRNLLLKITSIVLALIIWFNATTDRIVEMPVRVNVGYYNLKDGLVVSNISSSIINSVIEARRRDFMIMKMFGREPVFNANLKEARKGEFRVAVDKSMILFPITTDMNIVRINQPDEIIYYIDSVYSKTVPVMPVINGKPSEGYIRSSNAVIEPDKVTITGGRSVIDNIGYVETEVIDITGSTKTLRKTAYLRNKNEYSEISPSDVLVTIPIEKQVTKVFESVPVTFLNKPKYLSIEPESISLEISITGPESRLKNMLPGELSPAVDLSEIRKKGSYSYEINIDIQGLIITGILPQTIVINAK